MRGEFRGFREPERSGALEQPGKYHSRADLLNDWFQSLVSIIGFNDESNQL
jgi:hypothetical protein